MIYWAFVGFLLRHQLLETTIVSDLVPKKEKRGTAGNM